MLISEQNQEGGGKLNLKGYINPLSFFPVDVPGPDGSTNRPTLEQILLFLCPPGIPSNVESLVERYRELGQVGMALAVAPNEQEGLERIVWPLRQARAAYMVGNYLSVIALCGMVGEMAAILLWKLSESKIDQEKKKIDFEGLPHVHRIKTLVKHEIITPENKRPFTEVKNIRNRYLHRWSEDHGRLSTDARKICLETEKLVEIAMGASFQDGKVVLPSELIEYLKKHGCID